VAGGGWSGAGGGQGKGQGERERGGEKRKKKKTAKVVISCGGGGSVRVEVWFQHRTIPGADGQVNSRGGGDDRTDGLDRRLHAVCIPV